jgi:hypothetical protein
MAKETGTVLFLNGAQVPNGTLGEGDSKLLTGINTGDNVTATKPVQVSLLTGEIRANWEAAWYALLPVSFWFSDYWTPVGFKQQDGQPGEPFFRLRYSFVWLFNPLDTDLVISVETLEGTTN